MSKIDHIMSNAIGTYIFTHSPSNTSDFMNELKVWLNEQGYDMLKRM